MTLRTHLLLVALAAVTPVLAFGVVASAKVVQQQRETQRRGAVDQARAVLTAVDAQLVGSISTLESLAVSRALPIDDFAGFRVSSARVATTQPSWVDVTLATPDGRLIFDLLVQEGAALGRVRDTRSFALVLETRRSQVGDVIVDPLLQGAAIPVRAPVVIGGELKFVLTAYVRPNAFRELIAQQHLPADWACAIVDHAVKFVARTPDLAPGSTPSPALVAALRGSREGWYRGLTLEGVDTLTAHVTSDLSGWSVAIGIPANTVAASALRTGMLTAIGAVLSFAVALFAAMIAGRRIVKQVEQLTTAARALGSGVEVRVHEPSHVREIGPVAAALADASVAVRERQALLEREKRALQEADLAKNEFLAMLSHELRNPLAALTSAAHLIKIADASQPAAKRARDVIERQTAHMSRLIEDLLDISRITMGKAPLELEPVELGDAVLRAVDVFRVAGRLARHDVQVAVAPVWVRGDRRRVEQIVSNLLDNALKFTPDGGKIAVTVSHDGAHARLLVADHGEGIAPELLGHIFELFVQGPRGIDRGRGGMGIGLALVKRLVEMHGGSVTVESAGAGKGATFTVELPVSQEAHAARAAETQAAPRSLRILVVEDNDDARMMLCEVLELQGHDVRAARDGATALAFAAEQAPEIAIVDLGLPDIDGYEVARRLRAAHAEVALIALTGYGQPEDRARAREAGFALHLVKPVDAERLQAAIAAVQH